MPPKGKAFIVRCKIHRSNNFIPNPLDSSSLSYRDVKMTASAVIAFDPHVI